MSLLEIKNLKLQIATGAGIVTVVDDLSLDVGNGETVGLVGESGCGKTTVALSIARLLQTPPFHYAGGEVRLEGTNVLAMPEKSLREVRGSLIGYVFQEPGVALNPAFPIRAQIKDALKLHRPSAANETEITRLLEMVGIPSCSVRAKDHPRQLSGGMQQRALLAIALAPQPKLLIADEPTAALDVTIQAQILDLLRSLKQRLGMALLFITHNLGILNNLADRVAVMYAGQIVEIAPTSGLLRHPLHPYTRALINSVPKLSNGAHRLSTIPGNVPRLGHFPRGCRFYPRCSSARPDCADTMPQLTEAEPGRWVRCPYANLL